MATERLLSKYRNLYRKLQINTQEWDTLQVRSVALLNICVNIISRLPVLQSAFTLCGESDLEPKLVGKQMQHFEKCFLQLREAVADMHQLTLDLGKLAQAGMRARQSERPTPSATTCNRRLGATPSLNQCTDQLQNIWQMYHVEWMLKEALLTEICLDATPADLQAVQELYAAQPNLDLAWLKDTLHVMTCTAPDI